jgi:prepilin-type N-terminal cleavage/methylation domain-containing protein
VNASPSTSSRRHRARGFTLLELALATAVGAIVVLTGITIVNSMFTTDATMDKRFSEVNDIERTRRIIQRSLTMLVMSDQAKPADAERLAANNSRSTRTAGTTSGSNSSSSASTSGGTSSTEATPAATSTRTLAPARFELAVSSDPQLATAVAAMRSGGSNQAAVQTLELVCARPPVPSGRPRWLLNETPDASVEEASTATAAEENDTKGLPKASRGRYELLPASDRDGNFWELWWRPLPPLDNDGATLPEYADPIKAEQLLGTPMRLCSHITEFKWSAFDDSENKTALSAIWSGDLPAYMRLELKTRAGLYADWLFEIDYSTGAETGGNTQQAATEQNGEGGGGGGAGGGGRGRGGGRGEGGNAGGGNGPGAGSGGPRPGKPGGPAIRVPRNPRSKGAGGGGGDGNGGGQ